MGTIESRLRKRIHILDGAIGTMIMQGRRDIADIHRAYLEAGADIISTNTFNANPLSLKESGQESLAPKINREAAELARRTVEAYSTLHGLDEENRPLVAGSIGPTAISLSAVEQHQDYSGRVKFLHEKCSSPTPELEFNRMSEAFHIQTEALIEGGVDLLLLETIYDLRNAQAAICGIKKAFEGMEKTIPVMISATLTEQGQLPSGHSLEELCEAVKEINPISIGLNCGFGVKSLASHLKRLSATSDTLISFHPNAGLPDESGDYPYSPAKMLDELREILQTVRVDIIGGCCGTTPEHIRLIAEEVHSHKY